MTLSANASAFWNNWGGYGWNPYDPWDPRFWLEEFFGGGYYGGGLWGYGGPRGGYGYPYYGGYGHPYYGGGYVNPSYGRYDYLPFAYATAAAPVTAHSSD